MFVSLDTAVKQNPSRVFHDGPVRISRDIDIYHSLSSRFMDACVLDLIVHVRTLYQTTENVRETLSRLSVCVDNTYGNCSIYCVSKSAISHFNCPASIGMFAVEGWMFTSL